MEDRYLCKAKRKDNGEWVTGYYVKGLDMYAKEVHLIFEPTTIFYSSGETDGWCEVDPSTICQCTGLKDKNGKLIWENDIVKRSYCLYSSEAKYEERENCGIVKYDKEYARFGYQCSVFAMLSESKKHDTIEVIGNIFDNPELLESEE